MKKIILLINFLTVFCLGASENKFGIQALSSDYVDPSGRFEKIMTYGKTLKMGFKRLDFVSGGLPGTIKVNQHNILSSPVRFDVVVNGKLQQAKKSVSVKKNGKNAAVITGSNIFNDYKIDTVINAKWDHTLEFKIILTPNKKFTLEKFILRFPLNLDKEKLLCGNDEPPNKRISGREAATKWIRKNITSNDEIANSMWHNLWIGNTKYGLAWSFENIKNWNCTKGREMVFTPKDNILSIQLINNKTIVTKPLEYKFYLNITPVAKMPKDWRSWRVGTRYNNLNKLAANKLIYWSFWRPGTKETHNSNWVFDSDRLKEIAKMDASSSKARMFYFIPSHYTWSTIANKDGKKYMLVDKKLDELTSKSLFTPDYSFQFKAPKDVNIIYTLDEWKKLFGNKQPITARAGERVCRLNNDLINHHLNIVNKFVNEYNIPGIYSDGIAPKADFTPGKNSIKDAKGNLRPVYAVEEYRNMYKRIRSEIFSKDSKNGLMIAHNSSIRFFPSLVFFDFILFGEDFFYWYRDPEKRDASPEGEFYYAHIWGDIDNLKTEYFRQYGMPQVLLPELRGANRKNFPELTRGTRTMLCYTIQFDMLYWPLFCDAKEVNTFDSIRSKFDTTGNATEKVDFIPYWENNRFTSNIQAVKVGYYEKHAEHDPYMPTAKPQKYLLLISNAQFEQQEFTLTIPSDLKNVNVKNAYTNKVVKLEKNQIKLELDPYDFTVLELSADE